MAFYFKNTKNDIIMTEEVKEDFFKKNICRFGEKNFKSDKVRDRFHLTSKNRGPAQNICNRNVTQKQSIIIPFLFDSSSNYDCHLLYTKIVV